MFFNRSSYKRPSRLKKAFKSFFSIIILSAFVFSVSYGVKQLSSLDITQLSGLSGTVAGEFVSRLSQTQIGRGNEVSSQGEFTAPAVSVAPEVPDIRIKARIAVFADSHNEFSNLQSAVQKAQDLQVDFIVHLGDLSDLGDLPNLTSSYNVLASSGISWFAVPGDRDLWKSRNRDNFLQVFKSNRALLSAKGVNLLVFDNAALQTPLDESEVAWFKNQVRTADYVFLSQPIWHLSEDRIMGVYNGDITPTLVAQREELLLAVRQSNIKAVFGGHHHRSSISQDPTKPALSHVAVGALASKKNVQIFPRFTLLTIYDDSSHKIEDILL